MLCKRKDTGYNSRSTDICDALKELSFDDIFNLHFLIREIGDLRVIKLRLKNSELNLSSADGYRLILVCNKKHDHVGLLKIYPKRGKHSKMDLSKSEYKELLKIYGAELKTGKLKSHDLQKELVEVV